MKRIQQWGLATGSLVSFVLALALGQDVRGAVRLETTPPNPVQVDVSPSPGASPTPTPSPDATATPTPVPTPTADPGVPGPDLNQSNVSAWSAVRNPNPARGGPQLFLSGWRFKAAFEGARVLRSQTVTHITVENANPAFWDIEFTDSGPARAVVTVVPHKGARLLDVRCTWYIIEPPFTEHRVAATLEGNSISFDVGRAFESEVGVLEPRYYQCFYIYARGTVPLTDTVPEVAASGSHGSGAVLAILAGLVAGALAFKSHRNAVKRTSQEVQDEGRD
jgi:hypothetical protein